MHNTDQPLQILIVDDDEDDFYITSDYIKNIPYRKYKIDWSYNYADAFNKLVANKYQLYFVDYRLGIKTGLDLLKEAIEAGCEEPIVLLTGKGTQEIDVKAMESGAFDYLIKAELNTEKLERCIRYSLERSSSIKALKANERKYRSMFEKSKDVVFISNTDLEILEINYAATDLLEYEADELHDFPITSLFTKRDPDFFISVLDEMGEINDYEVDLVSKTKQIKNCMISASVEISNTGEKYIQGIIHDNTSRKKAEKTALQAEKLAATGRLVRTLAHEVRNPLNNINLSVEQLLQLDNREEATLYLQIIQRNGNRIGDLITELLNSSRPSNIHLKPASLQPVMDKAISAAIDRMTLKRVDLQVKYLEKNAYTLLDEEKLHLAFLNIIINAVEAVQENSGVLKIAISSAADEYVVEIADNGCGISEENLQRLFEPYFTSKRNGMGLGLAATLNIIQSHNAHVDVKSEVGKGTTFTIGFTKEVVEAV
jgi:PAS domain S-box-containing protein